MELLDATHFNVVRVHTIDIIPTYSCNYMLYEQHHPHSMFIRQWQIYCGSMRVQEVPTHLQQLLLDQTHHLRE